MILNQPPPKKKHKKNNMKHKILVRPGMWTWDLWHFSLMRYLSATESTESIDCSQDI